MSGLGWGHRLVTLSSMRNLIWPLVLLVGGCGQPGDKDLVPGQVAIECDSDAPVRVLGGASWVSAASYQTQPDPGGTFALPARIGAANVYVDTNRNGVLDHLAEPSAPCQLESGRWRCRLVKRIVALHRSTATYVGEYAVGDERDVQDSTFIYGAAFDDGCAAEDAVSVCTADLQRCSQPAIPPIRGATEAVQTISMCGEGDVGRVDLDLRTRSRSDRAHVDQPPPLGLAVELRGSDADPILHIETDRPVERVLVWAGVVSVHDRSAEEILWTSEDDGWEIAGHGKNHSVRIPSSALEVCRRHPGCALNTQVLGIRANDTTLVLSEGRQIGTAI